MTRAEAIAETKDRLAEARRTRPCPECGGSLVTALQLTTDEVDQPEWIDDRPIQCHVLVFRLRCRSCSTLISVEQPIPMTIWQKT